MFGNTLLLCAGKKFDPWLDNIGQVQTTPSGHQIWYLQDCVCFKYNDGSGVKTLGVAFAEKRAARLKWENANTYCRSVKIGGMPCNLPTRDQLRAIFSLREEIDARDHTVAATPKMALGSWLFGGDRFAWSSTEYSANHAWGVSSNGSCVSHYKTSQGAVIPVREM